jgi:hypothetical protein
MVLLELFWWLVTELVGQLLFELAWAIVRWLWTGVGLPSPGAAAARHGLWSALAGASAGAISFAFHPGPVAGAAWMRVVGLVVLPIGAGAALASSAAALARAKPEGRPSPRTAFWTGVAFGAGYAAMRLVVPWAGRISH